MLMFTLYIFTLCTSTVTVKFVYLTSHGESLKLIRLLSILLIMRIKQEKEVNGMLLSNVIFTKILWKGGYFLRGCNVKIPTDFKISMFLMVTSSSLLI